MEEKKMEKAIIAKEAMKAINELEESTRLEGLIQDNKIKFVVKEKTFRVRKPNVKEQDVINTKRRVKYLELVNDDSYLFRKQWIEKYSKKGIDIIKMETDIIKLQDNIKSLLLRLASETSENSVTTLKKEIMKLRTEQHDINIEKVDLMAHCIEDELVIYANSYTSYMLLERLEGDKWVKNFESFEKYQECKDWELLNQMYYYINVLMYEIEL